MTSVHTRPEETSGLVPGEPNVASDEVGRAPGPSTPEGRCRPSNPSDVFRVKLGQQATTSSGSEKLGRGRSPHL